MVESRWFRRAGPGIAAMGALALIASTTTGARPGSWDPPPCQGEARIGTEAIGAWYRIDPTIVDGARTGQRLTVGVAGTSLLRGLDLDGESFGAGPFAGTVLAGTDDGTTSRVSLIDAAAGCAWEVDRSADVVRRATISPDGSALIEFRVDRSSRADLGVWKRPLRGGTDERILPPIDVDDRFGPTWLTELSWSIDGSLLAVQSCGEVACRVRWLDPQTGIGGGVSDPSLGDLVGITRDRLVAHGSCRGLPCPIRSAVLATGKVATVARSAGQAAVVRDERGQAMIVYEPDEGGRWLATVGLDGRGTRRISADAAGRRMVGTPAWSGGAMELPVGWVAFGPDGRFPLAGPVPAVLRRVSDGRTVPFGEVQR